MASIQYTASRNFVAKGININSSDISVDASDNSFNSIFSDLSGVLTDEFVFVSGFNDPANNGWFLLSSDSTANKILVTTSLVNEASGANINLTGYEHGPDAYELLFSLSGFDKNIDENKSVVRAIGGNKETLLHSEKIQYTITTDHILDANEKYWDEFFSSVRAGETFVFDAYGDFNSPDNPVTVSIEGKETWTRWKKHRRKTVLFTIEVV